MLSFEELYRTLLESDETSQIEAKRSEEIGESALQTVCAFSNEPDLGGGYLLLGVSRTKTADGNRYAITGVKDPDRVQAELANRCRGVFNVCIRPEICIHVTSDGKRVVVVRVPEADPSDKPVYLKKPGLPKGAYRRIGSADHVLTDRDMRQLFQSSGSRSEDSSTVAASPSADIDRTAVREYRRARAELSPTAEELRLGSLELLRSIGAVEREGTSLSLAGLLLFGKASAIRRLCPWARIDYVLVPGNEWVTDQRQRYRSVEILQPLLLAVPKVVDLVVQDLPKAIQIRARRTKRREVPVVPFAVIREAIVNAVMHRDYRVYEPIQIIKFANRLEIRNPGYSLISDERLGTPGSQTRNPTIAAVLHETGFAETKGTGIRVMREQMHKANLTAPLFRTNRSENCFDVTLLTHHLLDAETVRWLQGLAPFQLNEQEAKGLVLARQVGYIDNQRYRDANDVDVLTASNALRRLRDVGLLETHGKSTATFYTLSGAALDAPPSNLLDKRPLSRRLEGGSPSGTPMSTELLALLRKIGARSVRPELLEIAILRLCAIRPMSLAELAGLIGRDSAYLSAKFIGPLVKRGDLTYLYPKKPAHPRQAYLASPRLMEIPIPGETDLRKKRHRRDAKNPKLPGF